MKKLIVLLSLIPIVFIQSQNNFNFNIDFSSFKYDSTSNYVEFYYSFPQDNLKLMSTGDSFQIEGLLHLQIKNKENENDFINKDWRIPSLIQDTSGIALKGSLVGVVGFVVPQGNYICNVSGSDNNNPDMKKGYNFPIDVKPFGDKDIIISDIQLASSIRQEGVDEKSIFYKNTLEVIPIPSVIYGESAPVLYYYVEIYNLNKISQSDELSFDASIFDPHGKKIYYKSKNLLKRTAAALEVGTINVSKYLSGKYSLVVSISDKSRNKGFISKKEFFVYNPAIKDTTTFANNNAGVLSSQFAFLSNDECDDIFDKSEYIASKKDVDLYENIRTVEGKREFLVSFWYAKENDANQEIKYSFNEYMDRVRIANGKYKNIGSKGWKSDMGRVFIKYGPPTQVDRHPNEQNARPYEIWEYQNIEGGVEFIFGDITGFSNYILLTSSKRGEYQDYNWMQRIATVPE